MNKRRHWLWVALFIGVALVIATLGLGWNVVLVRDYERIAELAHSISQPNPPAAPVTHLIASLVLGTLGFFAVLGSLILFFLRLLREMKVNQQQSEFLATVTHELKTPIAAMELASSLIQEGGLTPEELKKLWNSHNLELARLRSEVESLLEAARWESTPVTIEAQLVNLETWLSDSMERWKSILGPNAELSRDGEALRGPAQLDLRKLNLISDNILQNSKKYAKGAPKVMIHTSRIKSRFGQDRWQIEFKDFGWGFDPNDAQRILKPFYRSKSQVPYAIPGAGLGLYIASSASRALGMKMRGTSAGRGEGATFFLEGKEFSA